MARYTDYDLARWRKEHGEPSLPLPPKPRKRPGNEESQIQQAFIRWWAIACKQHKIPEFLLYAVPNGHMRSEVTGAILKREGLRSGAPDLNLDVPIGKYHGLRIEMKTATGKPSDAQKEFIAALQARGYAAGCAYGYDDAVRFIEAYLRGEVFF
jgi:hypothetical protein